MHKPLDFRHSQTYTPGSKKGEAARIVFKVNSLVEGKAMQALYRASQAGVEVKLIVRGICSLRPGVKGHIAVHQVRTGCINLLISAILKHIHPGMLKITPND
jgi:polyphosphate kinase